MAATRPIHRPNQDEPPDGTMLLGFDHTPGFAGQLAGVWHRRDGGPFSDGPHRWYCTYYDRFPTLPYTWEEALARGAHPAMDLHTSPTQDAYDRACAALEKHRQRAGAAETALARVYGHLAEVEALEEVAPEEARDVAWYRLSLLAALDPDHPKARAFLAEQEGADDDD